MAEDKVGGWRGLEVLVSLQVDFTDVESNLIPKGKYRATIETAELVTSSNGNSMLSVMWRVNDLERVLFQNWMLEGKGLGITMNIFAALGLGEWKEINGKKTLGVVDFDYEELIGREAIISVGHDKWEGQERNKVTWVYPAPAAEVPF